jgi:hypothetical protein
MNKNATPSKAPAVIKANIESPEKIDYSDPTIALLRAATAEWHFPYEMHLDRNKKSA